MKRRPSPRQRRRIVARRLEAAKTVAAFLALVMAMPMVTVFALAFGSVMANDDTLLRAAIGLFVGAGQ